MDSTMYTGIDELSFFSVTTFLCTPMISFALSNNIVSSTGGPLTTSSACNVVVS